MLLHRNTLKFYIAMKVYKYGLFSAPYFVVFRLNNEIYGVMRENVDEKKFHIGAPFLQYYQK